MDTKTALDNAISAHAAHIRERDELDPSPVLAWVVVAVIDDNGDDEAAFSILTADGQRGFITRGLLTDALDAMRIHIDG